MAVDLMPLPFFERAIREVPKNMECTEDGVFPQSTRLTNGVKASRRALPPLLAEVLTRSFKCCELRPSDHLQSHWGRKVWSWTLFPL